MLAATSITPKRFGVEAEADEGLERCNASEYGKALWMAQKQFAASISADPSPLPPMEIIISHSADRFRVDHR